MPRLKNIDKLKSVDQLKGVDERFVIQHALALAVEAMKRLPSERQDGFLLVEMEFLLNRMLPSEEYRSNVVAQARARMRVLKSQSD
jgi:hypothetical protein